MITSDGVATPLGLQHRWLGVTFCDRPRVQFPPMLHRAPAPQTPEPETLPSVAGIDRVTATGSLYAQ